MKRRSFRRVSNIRDYRPVFIIATEGKKTEPDYFRMRIFKHRETTVQIKVLATKSSSSPLSVLSRIKKYIRNYRVKEKDEAWLVVDKDNWKDEHLEELHNWSISYDYANLAVSNPQFEYWLLLHFEDGNDVPNKTICINRLKCHLQNYNKSNIPVDEFSPERVRDAIRRAKLKDSPPCNKWPVETGTTVYRMIERLIQ